MAFQKLTDMRNGVILYVKNKDRQIKSIDKLGRNDNVFNPNESKEIYYLTRELIVNGFNVFISNFEDVDENNLYHKDVYDINKHTFCDFNIDMINKDIAVIFPRMLGSIEKQRDRIYSFFMNLKTMFKGFVINNPNTVVYGLKKYYLRDFSSYNINVPHTDIYDTNVPYDYLKNKYHKGSYIIKPLTGELGNSVELLSDISQEFLDYKKNKVGGWIVQPFYETIWKGERQYVYVDNKLVYGYLKGYKNDDNDITKLPRLKKIDFQKDFAVKQSDVELCQNALKVLNSKLNYSTYICRFDIIDDFNGAPMILECELVNPSFRSWYIQLVTKEIVEFIKRKVS